MLSWTLQRVKERLIAALSVVRWPERRVLKQSSLLPIWGAELKFIKSSKSKILGLFSVFQAFFVALKDTLPQTADPWCMSIRWSGFFVDVARVLARGSGSVPFMHDFGKVSTSPHRQGCQ